MRKCLTTIPQGSTPQVNGGGSAGDRETGHDIVCSTWKHVAVEKQAMDLRTIANVMSVDYAVGLPFNISSYALLTHILAERTGLRAESLIMQLSHVHVYEQHVSSLRQQLQREPYPLPELVITSDLTPDLKGMDSTAFKLNGYVSHPAIQYEMVVT
jgi:thymidylate synthase